MQIYENNPQGSWTWSKQWQRRKYKIIPFNDWQQTGDEQGYKCFSKPIN